ncbi:MAG: 50S ribosomal protein L6 [Candidatus Diapherotrites archaeon]
MAERTVEKVTIPAGITPAYERGVLTLTKNGKNVSKKLVAPEVTLRSEGNTITITPLNKRRFTIATMRSHAAHIRNLITGLEKGFKYKLAVVHSHFPMNIKVKEKHVEIANYLGEKNPRLSLIIGETKVEVKGKEITVSGNNIEEVSQTAANLEKATRDTKKDQRVFQDGIYITEKGETA